MIRLFIALPLPFDIRARLAGLAGGVPGARWVEAEDLHLTLRFIGDVDEGRLPDLDAELLRIEPPDFSLVLDGCGQFGTGRKIHTLWIGAERNEALSRLQAKVEAAVVRAGFPPEPRKFSAHVTLARLKDANPERLTRFLAGNGLFRSVPFPVTGFALYQSHLGHGGARYQKIQAYPHEDGDEAGLPIMPGFDLEDTEGHL